MGAQFGMIGLGVMGENLALNIEEHGFPVAVWNLEPETTQRFISENSGRRFTPTASLEELVRAVDRPRRIMMMIPAGAPVDQTIKAILPHLENGDVLIDGGNSWFKDTQERSVRVQEHGIHYVGAGVSGGEDGARFGASLMPGGTPEAWREIQPVFEAIAARSDSGPCVTHVGPDGAGHFVKMVHNGIEYADMQLIAEAYEILRRGRGMPAGEIAEVIERWNSGPLESFLLEITARILRVRDAETGDPLVDKVLDKAGQKGTGKWTAQVALELGVAVPVIAAAIDARILSSMKAERVEAERILGRGAGRPSGDAGALVDDLHDALYASRICAYAQGMSLIATASAEWKWNVDLREIARIWKAGCIIRARLLDTIMRVYEQNPQVPNLLVAPDFTKTLLDAQGGWRRIVSYAQSGGLAVPAMSMSLAYFDAYRTASLPQNLIQAQRDFFGAHTYQRTDKGPDAPFVHSEWD